MSAAPQRLRVPRDRSSLARARTWLDRHLGAIPPQLQVRVKLLANELMTNSVRHAGAPDGEHMNISVARGEGTLQVQVCDSGPGFDPDAAPQGMGLYLLKSASARWGVRRSRGRFCVWFVVPLPV